MVSTPLRSPEVTLQKSFMTNASYFGVRAEYLVSVCVYRIHCIHEVLPILHSFLNIITITFHINLIYCYAEIHCRYIYKTKYIKSGTQWSNSCSFQVHFSFNITLMYVTHQRFFLAYGVGSRQGGNIVPIWATVLCLTSVGSVKCPFGLMSVRPNARSAYCSVGRIFVRPNVRSANCSFR